jgi:hypothetical protein
MSHSRTCQIAIRYSLQRFRNELTNSDCHCVPFRSGALLAPFPAQRSVSDRTTTHIGYSEKWLFSGGSGDKK